MLPAGPPAPTGSPIPDCSGRVHPNSNFQQRYAFTPKLVSRDLIGRMKKGSVVVDVAIDQGGCFETSRPTTHESPTYVVDGVIHYCVANMPGGVPRTSTFALNNSTLPFVLALADKGYRRALAEDAYLRTGLNVHQGRITHEAVSRALGLPFTDPLDALGPPDTVAPH